MLACRARVSFSLSIAAVFLSTVIASIWTVSAESKVHDESTVCTSDARNFAEAHSIAPDMALLQKKAVPGQAPALLEESATTASAMPKYKNVPLSEQGYSFVSQLNDNREMQGFVRRVLKSLGLEIVDEGGLMGMVPYYSGKKAKQSLAALEDELAKEIKKRKSWVLPEGHKGPALLEQSATTASAMPKYKNVPLSEQGYSLVSQLKNNREMQGFVRRVLESLGLEIVDEGGLMGMVPYYSGKKAKQSLAALEDELAKEMKKRKSWVLPKGTKANEKGHTDLLAIKHHVADREEQGEDTIDHEGTGNSNMREAVSDELGDSEEYDEEMLNQEGQQDEDEEYVEEDELEEPKSDPVAVETKKHQSKPRSPLKVARKSARRA